MFAVVATFGLSRPVDAAKRCDWHAEKAFSGEQVYRKCLDLAALNGKTLDIPKNITRVAQDGFSFCPNAFRTEIGAEADIVYLLDNSGSMWEGDGDSRFNSCAGDPFERRGEVLIQSLRLQRQLAVRTSASFIPFAAQDNIQKAHVIKPVEIGSAAAGSAAAIDNLETHIRKSISDQSNNKPDRCENFRDELLKQSATSKIAETFWGNTLNEVQTWRQSDPILSKSSRPAIVLISDGAISDWDRVKKMVPNLPPVYGIHLGYRLNAKKQPDNASTFLDTLTRLTGGKFYRVAPSDTTTMRLVMEEIVRSIVSNPLPTALKVTNQSLEKPQVSLGQTLRANPDSSVGVVMDSILALKEGANVLKVEVTLNDASVRQFSLTLNAESGEASRNGATYTCYDPPTLTLLGADGKAPMLYAGTTATYTLDLTRSPSELSGVQVTATSSDSSRNDKNWGDREALTLPAPSMASGIPEHKGQVTLDGRSDAPKAGNGRLESDQAGSVTLTWNHPRDVREAVTYTLPGKIIPVVDPVGDLQPPKEPARGPDVIPSFTSGGSKIILSEAPKQEGQPVGVCVSGCDIVKQTGVTPDQIPTWTLPVNAPFDYQYQVFDNLGQFISQGQGSFTLAQYEQVRKSGDTAKVALSLMPVADDGRHLGTGAYIMRLDVTTQGELVMRNAAGDEVRVRSTSVHQTRRFGYVRRGSGKD